MTANELSILERSPIVESHPKLFHPQILLAYKFQALSLESRAMCKSVFSRMGDNFREFTGTQFLLRNYSDIRWDKRITVSAQQLFERNCDHIFPVRPL
jgi:hypothetical protein